MTFRLADEVFAGTTNSFAETVPLGHHGTPEDSQRFGSLACFTILSGPRGSDLMFKTAPRLARFWRPAGP